MGFNAVVGAGDRLGDRDDADILNIAKEQTHDFETGTLSPDIVAKQEKLRKADVLIPNSRSVGSACRRS